MPSPERAVAAFQQLSAEIGRKKTIWRYDPIIFSDEMDVGFHAEKFQYLAERLEGYTDRCQISFVDFYKKAERNIKSLNAKKPHGGVIWEAGRELAAIARRHGISLEACAEKADLASLGIGRAKCIDERLIADIAGKDLKIAKDKNQRQMCGCVASIDIGAYNTCSHGCRYCYANFSDKAVAGNIRRHNPQSPLLIGDVEPGDKILERKMVSCSLPPASAL